MKPKRENDNPKLANQKNKNQKSNLTFYYLIAIYLGVFQFHNMLQSHWHGRYVCVSAVLKDMQKSKILDGRSYIVYLNTMTKTNAFLNIQIFLLKFEHSQKHSFLEHCLCCGYVIILNNLNSINKIPTH